MSLRIIPVLREIFLELIEKTAVYLPDDVLERIKSAAEREENERARRIYGIMLENLRLAAERRVPLCQDTGVLEFFVKAGADFPHLAEVRGAIVEATAEATEKVPLRPNAVEGERNTGNNVATGLPWIEWEVVDGTGAEIALYLAGGGSSLPGASKVVPPHSESLEDMIVKRIAEYGANACPPLFIGVGVGATSEMAAMLSKRALIRPLRKENEEERAVMEKINGLNIGPQGLGGGITALGVSIERSARHPATFAVGLSTGCWAHRRGIVRIDKDLGYEIVSHRRLE
jgi:L(+)-tartrate dehydratase alpha subunit